MNLNSSLFVFYRTIAGNLFYILLLVYAKVNTLMLQLQL